MLKCNEIKYEGKHLASRFSIHARPHLLVQEILDHTHLDLSIYGIGRHGSRLLFPRSRKKLMPKKKKKKLTFITGFIYSKCHVSVE